MELISNFWLLEVCFLNFAASNVQTVRTNCRAVPERFLPDWDGRDSCVDGGNGWFNRLLLDEELYRQLVGPGGAARAGKPAPVAGQKVILPPSWIWRGRLVCVW